MIVSDYQFVQVGEVTEVGQVGQITGDQFQLRERRHIGEVRRKDVHGIAAKDHPSQIGEIGDVGHSG